MKKIIIILLILASGLLSGCLQKNVFQKLEESTVSNTTNPEQVSGYKEKKASITEDVLKTAKVFLVIDFGVGEIKELEVEFKEEMTVFDLLQKGAEEQRFVLETKSYSLGVFIETIGDKKNGQDGKYWLYYVNDKFAQVAADKFKLKAGDKVEWKFAKPTF